jgi:tripartite-type tricarboxylate transporter receptor subunit TctC
MKSPKPDVFVRSLGLPVLAVLSGISTTLPTRADAVSDFYTGRTISIMVGFGPGGGYDIYARLLARHFGAHMPGRPNVIVQNMPGAAGLGLANSLYNVLPKDGTVFGTFNRTIPLEPLLDGSRAQFDPLAFNWLGSPSSEVSACVAWHSARAKSLDDLKTTEMLMAGTGPAADATMYPKVFGNILGLKFKVVSGYQGAADSILAMERGEVDGFCPWGWSSMMSTRPDWLMSGKINVLMQLGIRKDPAHPDVPLILDLAKTPADRQALELMVSPLLFARPFAAPPQIPGDRAQALRAAFKATIEDPAFVEDAKKNKLDIEYVSDTEILTLLRRIYATPKDVVERVKASLK